MATDKNSFLLYTDLIHLVRKLPKETRGDLFLVILEYVNDNITVVEAMTEADMLLNFTFEPIKQQLKRDLKKYETIREKKRLAGVASAEKRKQNQQVLTGVDTCQQSATHSTVNVSVNDSVNVNDNVIERENIIPTPTKFNSDYIVPITELENVLLSDDMWIESLARLHMFDRVSAQNSISIAKGWVKKYVADQMAENVKMKSRADAFSHCKRWINTRLKNEHNKTTDSNTRSVADTDKHNSEKL
jgi:hypothetical protein